VKVVGATRARLLAAGRERALRRHDPRGIALAWAHRLVPIDVPGLTVGADDPRLVVLPKLGGTEDVVATLTDRGALGLRPVALPRGEVKAVFRAVLGPAAPLLSDTDYRPGDESLRGLKEDYRALLAAIVRELHQRVPLAGFIGANVAYYAERELAAACEQVGIPFIVLHKEAIRTPRQREHFTRAYRERIGPFGGRLIATYNDDERDSQVSGGLVGAERIRVVGSPRVDALHRLRESRATQPAQHEDTASTTVLFAVDPAAGTWTPFDGEQDSGAPRWDELAQRTEQAFASLASAHPQRRFVIKVKLGREIAALERLATTFPGGPPPNLEIVTGGTATSLLASAAAAVAFNSTVILEGLAAGIPVVVPRFAEASVTEAHGWMLRLDDAVESVDSEQELMEAIARAWQRGPSAVISDPARTALERYVGDADGGAADRFFAALSETVRMAP